MEGIWSKETGYSNILEVFILETQHDTTTVFVPGYILRAKDKRRQTTRVVCTCYSAAFQLLSVTPTMHLSGAAMT